MPKKIAQLLIVGGTGRNVGKTTAVCSIIRKNAGAGICAIKITPHFHKLTDGLIRVFSSEGFIIFSESDSETTKDSARMLKAGADKVLLIQATDDCYDEAFTQAMKIIGENRPVICESPSLRYHFEPGIFVMIQGDLNDPTARPDSTRLLNLADLVIKSDDAMNEKLPPLIWSAEKKRWTRV